MVKPKRNAYAVLGFIVWKVLAVLGLKMAKDKVAERLRERRDGGAE